jgi:tetratricopeptide (TPR) repeat protein
VIPNSAAGPLRTGNNPSLVAVVPPDAASPSAAKAAQASPAAFYERALTLAAMGFHQAAAKALRDLTTHVPGHADAWRKLAELLRMEGEDEQAEAACAAADRLKGGAQSWPRAADRRSPEMLAQAELKLREMFRTAPWRNVMAKLREQLFRNVTDAAAMRLLAHLERRDGDKVTACTLLERALELAPDYDAARADLANFLMERRRYGRALALSALLLESAPRDTRYRAIRVNALRAVGRAPDAISLLEGLIEDNPQDPRFRGVYGQVLYFVGRREESVRAYRACLEMAPAMGEAYWGLAELRGNFLTDDDIAAMRTQLQRDNMEPSSRMMMLYALGHALERAGDFSGSFEAYQQGARLVHETALRAGTAHDPAASTERVRRRKVVLTAANMAARPAPTDSTKPSVTPIFIVGMPRAGSTLVEQILASHSLVEATLELPVLGEIAEDLSISRAIVTPDAYPECVLNLTRNQLSALGARYTEGANAYRKTGRPYFIDKQPFNWIDVGLIHLILPHAKIIDVRREPMAACFGMFKQILPHEATFSYDLAMLGRYYNEYVGMMRHYEAVLPGRVHFLSYERLVDDTETEIRRLLEYCGLPFEAGCLRFWETDRAIATPSAAQVRRPIFRDALQHWRNYEPFLGPLKEALEGQGSALDPLGP